MGDLKIEHLLTMTTGHDADTTRFVVSEQFLRHRSELRVGDRADRNDLRGFFELPITHAPGTHFVYNSGASMFWEKSCNAGLASLWSNTCSVVFSNRWASGSLNGKERGTEGNTGGWGLRLTTEDIARFGQFLLQKGVWNEKRILPSTWIRKPPRAASTINRLAAVKTWTGRKVTGTNSGDAGTALTGGTGHSANFAS